MFTVSMGYSTDFYGSFTLDKPLSAAHAEYLHAFSDTRRMKRDANIAARLPDPVRDAAGLPVGPSGAYFVGGGGDLGQGDDDSIVDCNSPAEGQPGLWCGWVPADNVDGITWNGWEKFYHYREWLQYLIDHFLAPWGYTLTGSVRWRGDDLDDHGTLEVVDGKVVAKRP